MVPPYLNADEADVASKEGVSALCIFQPSSLSALVRVV